MKLMVLGSLFALLSAPAFAGCEDGQPMAGEAAVKAAEKATHVKCRDTFVSDPIDTKAGQDFWVKVRCGAKPLTYKVSLREIEDAMCVVKSVTLTNAPLPLPNPTLKCPKPGTTINCMPITTNPWCAKRAWVSKNCPGVHFLD